MNLTRPFLVGACWMLTALAALAGTNQWTGSGPLATGLGNRVIGALAVSPDGLTVYAGTGSGTVFAYTPTDCSLPITVTSAADSGAGTLRQAIADACPGGTIQFSIDSDIVLTSSVIIDKDLTILGPATVSGDGAVRIFEIPGTSNVTLRGLTLTNGWGTAGGGALMDNGSATTLIDACVFTGNGAQVGGAIVTSGAMTITGSSFNNNRATSGAGGAITTYSTGGPLFIANSLFAGNSASSGGGATALGVTATLTNVTLTGNTAGTGGGALWASGGAISLVNATIAGNSTSGIGGGILISNGAVTLRNSLAANNTAANNGPDIFGTLFSQGNNLIRSVVGATIGGSVAGNLTGVDPLLGPLADNGGPTQTMALLNGSPATDAGLCSSGPATDQRGLTRPQDDTCDIGAYERGAPASLAITGGNPQSTLITTLFPVPLSVRVADALGAGLAGEVVTFTGPAIGAGILGGGSATTGATGVASFTVTANGTLGSYQVTASAGGLTANFNLTNDDGKLDQTISFGPAPTLVVGGTGTLSAAATSGLPVSFSSLTGAICSVTGNSVRGLALGTCRVAADQAGNAAYRPAPQVPQAIPVGQPGKLDQTIRFGPAPTLTVGGTGTLSATASSGLPVSFSSLTGAICSVTGNTVRGLAPGTCRVAADQTGNAQYNPAPRVTLSLTVAAGPAAIPALPGWGFLVLAGLLALAWRFRW